MVINFIREGFDVIVDYTFDKPKDLELIVTDITQNLPTGKRPDLKVFHLTASVATVIKRNKKRNDGKGSLDESVLIPLFESCKSPSGILDNNVEISIETDRISVKKVVDLIMETISHDH